ncbi:hypothetical protein [Qipengyuania atrilutea]|uniref:DUF883 domain-containing protein n=1 Tax=Qipengyuania atrilutea TaxID=2744473 RepID=A0A850H3U0_9SPHN|nr:hypothetical protein [Actirhodobacter atriluteus]NVD43745.1 hypothetical protein [Actirhodobacter atriluteus]
METATTDTKPVGKTDTVPSDDVATGNSGNMTREEKRDLLRERIEAGERRNQERSLGDYAKDAADNAKEFAKDHPVATIAGAIAVGLAIGAMTRPGRRLARQGAVRTGALAAIAADAIAAYSASLIDGAGDLARNSGDALEDFGDTVSGKARTLRRRASYEASSLADSAGMTKRSLARKARRSYRDTRHSLRH